MKIHAQSEKTLSDLLREDRTASVDSASVMTDSLGMATLRNELEEARRNEMNLRLELETVRMETIVQDSIKRREQRDRIDSLKNITKGYPVVVDEDTLFCLYAKRGGLLPEVRAGNISDAILRLGKRFMVQPDSVYLESTDITTDIMYGNEVIASFTDQDALWENTTRDELAHAANIKVCDKIRDLQKQYGLEQFIKRCALFLFLFIVQVALILLTNWLYRKGVRKIARLR
ncbi:MAG: mechanosensitive ion channel family protein, partial [Tannerella sp.]|nr:mechanosensitive ion channel family protein [Tannerella sp.]